MYENTTDAEATNHLLGEILEEQQKQTALLEKVVLVWVASEPK